MNKYLFFFFLLAVSMSCSKYDLGGDVLYPKRPVDAYNYPIHPGTKAWDDLESRTERIEATRIPQKRLEEMSVAALVLATWEHPFFFEVSGAFDSSTYRQQAIFDKYVTDIDAMRQLTKTEGVAQELLCCYGRLPSDYNEIEPLMIRAFHLLCAQKVFLDQLSYDEKVEFASLMIQQEQCYDREIALLFFARCMYYADYQPFLDELANHPKGDYLLRYILEGNMDTSIVDSFREVIMLHANNFIL